MNVGSILANFVKTMEKEVEEGNKPKKHKLIFSNPDWLDLPDPIATNIILEHLEIVDYIRFSAVCKKWHSIQMEHQIRYSPYPPPLSPPFPWLGRGKKYKHDACTCFLFHLPDKQRSYRIPFLKTSERIYKINHWHGCLLLLVESDVYNRPVLCIFNPITSVLIKLPPCSESDHYSHFHGACISSPLTDPDCTIFTEESDGKIYLYRLNDNDGWKKINRPKRYKGSRSLLCDKKIYIIKRARRCYMIDTLLPVPIEQRIEMDRLEINAAGLQFSKFRLVNFFGEVVMVIIVYEDSVEHDYDTIKEFHVYKADFSTYKWMRMETLGDGVLFYGSGSIFGLSAIDVGCKRNTIYSAGGPKGRGVGWRAFDISTRDWIDGPPFSFPRNECRSNFGWSWFFPTLEYINVAETDGAC